MVLVLQWRPGHPAMFKSSPKTRSSGPQSHLKICDVKIGDAARSVESSGRPSAIQAPRAPTGRGARAPWPLRPWKEGHEEERGGQG